jgi:hypothetical protein
MGPVLTLADWNKIIQQINDLAGSPPDGCNGTSALSPVTDPHRWSKTDIKGVQDALQAICSSNTFDTIPDLWKQKTIDDINAAIAAGWCDICKQQSVKTYEVVSIHGCEAVPNISQLSDPLPFVTATKPLGYAAWVASQAYYQDYLDRCKARADLATEQAKPHPDSGIIASIQAQIDAKTSDMANQRSIADSSATMQGAFWASYDSCAMAHDLSICGRNMWHLVAALTGHPWADKPCSPKDMLGPLRESWTLSYRYGLSGPFNYVMAGSFSPGGVPYSIDSNAAPIAGQKAVWCCCGEGCLTPNPSWFPPYTDLNPCSRAENTTDFDGSTTWSIEYRWYA